MSQSFVRIFCTKSHWLKLLTQPKFLDERDAVSALLLLGFVYLLLLPVDVEMKMKSIKFGFPFITGPAHKGRSKRFDLDNPKLRQVRAGEATCSFRYRRVLRTTLEIPAEPLQGHICRMQLWFCFPCPGKSKASGATEKGQWLSLAARED